MYRTKLIRLGVLAGIILVGTALKPAHALEEYLLTPGDVIKVSVFKNPDLMVDARVSEAGTIGFPLVGSVPVAGLTLPAAERKIAQLLKDGGFVISPQVNILLTTAVGNQVAVLGQVNRPGRYPIEGAGGNLTGMLAEAGGIATTGADVVIVTGMRNGKPFRMSVQLAEKVYQTFVLEVTDPGGHSASGRRDNAIYRLADALRRLGQFDFSVGLNPVVIKTAAFAISAAFAGLAGAIFAPLMMFVAPDSFPFSQSILFLLAVIVGGAGWVFGPLVGAIVTVLRRRSSCFLGSAALAVPGCLSLPIASTPLVCVLRAGRWRRSPASPHSKAPTWRLS